jgi:hypothetical protein
MYDNNNRRNTMTLTQIVSSAKKVGIVVTASNGKWNLRYADSPTMRPLRLSSIADVRLVVVAEITTRLATYPQE